MKRKWSLLGTIFWTFFRMAPVTFGGGFAMIPMLEREAVHKRKWIAQDEVTDVLAVSQTIPGAVALNTASFVGFRVAGTGGAIAAIAGMLLPTFLIVIGLAAILLAFHDNVKVSAVLEGVKPAVVALIVYAGWRIAKTALQGKLAIGIALLAALLLLQNAFSPIWVIVLGGAIGVFAAVWKRRHHPNIRRSGRQSPEPDYFFGDGI